MAGAQVRKVDSKKEMEILTDDYITQGYEVIEEGERTKMFRKKTWGTAGGHVLCALLTIWWTVGFGNLVYALVAHFGAEKILLKIEPNSRKKDDRVEEED